MRRFLARQFAGPSGWIGRYLIGPWLNRIGAGMNPLALHMLEPLEGERILELGFGGGDFADLLLKRGADVTGVDASEAMVARAACRFRRDVEEGRARFLHGFADSLPLREGSFDKACSVNAIYFWSDLDDVMAELARVLRTGGTLVLCFQTPEAVRRWPGHRYGFIAYGADEVGAAMEAAGFRLSGSRTGSDRRVGAFVSLKGERL